MVMDEIELSLNPRDDLPAEVFESVDAFLQITDGEVLGDRTSAMVAMCTGAWADEPVDQDLAAATAVSQGASRRGSRAADDFL